MSEHRHEHRMEHDGPGWRAVLGYGRHFRALWSSEVNQETVRLAAPTEGEIALDVGAGMGAAVFIAADNVGEKGLVLAVEPTPFMRRTLAVRRWTSRHRRRVEILDGVAEQLPVGSGRVDVAWAVNVLHHMSDLGRAADELRRVMAPGGRIVLVDEDFDDTAHPEHEEMKHRRGHAHHGGDHHHGTDGHGHHHLMVDVASLGETLASREFVEIEAGDRFIAGIPVRMVTASLPEPVR